MLTNAVVAELNTTVDYSNLYKPMSVEITGNKVLLYDNNPPEEERIKREVILRAGEMLYFDLIPEDICQAYGLCECDTAQVVQSRVLVLRFSKKFNRETVPLSAFADTTTMISLEVDLERNKELSKVCSS